MKNVLLICLFFAGILSVDAQIAVGPRVGANFAWWKGSGPSTRLYESKPSVGPMAGAVIELPFGGSFSIETGLFYSVRNFQYRSRGRNFTKYSSVFTVTDEGNYRYIPIRDNLIPVGESNQNVQGFYFDGEKNVEPKGLYNDELYSLKFLEIPLLFRYKTYGRFSGVYAQTGFMYSTGLSATVRRKYTYPEAGGRNEINQIYLLFDGELPGGSPLPVQVDIDGELTSGEVLDDIYFGKNNSDDINKVDIAWVWGGGYYINVGLSGQILIDVRQAVGLVDITSNSAGLASSLRTQRYNRQVCISVTYLHNL
jgi:hypothetical protein